MDAILHHVSIPVSDLERARQFYRDVLGLTEISRPSFRLPGAWFRIGETQELHLIAGNSDATFRGTRGLDPNDAHFAVRVGDHEQVLELLRGKGYRENADDHDPMAMRTSTGAGYPQLYILDPDRNVIEINTDSRH